MYNKIERLCQIGLKLTATLGILIFGYLVLFSWTTSMRIYADSEIAVHTGDHIWKHLLFTMAALVIFGGVGALLSRVKGLSLHVIAMVISVLVAVFCCILVRDANAYPVADQIYVYKVVTNFLSGDYHNIQTEWYYNAYPYQLGLGLLYGTFLKVIGGGTYLALQYMQAVLTGVIVYISFLITLELFQSRKAAGTCLLCSSCFLPMYLYPLYIYGETLFICFALFSVLFLLLGARKRRKPWQRALLWTLSILCMSAAYVAKISVLILLVALLLIGIVRFFKDRKWIPLLVVFAMLPVALGVQELAVQFVERQAEVELAEGVPMILPIAMGIQDNDVNGTGPGSYNAYDILVYYESGFDGKKSTDMAVRSILKTFYRWYQDPIFMFSYMQEKMLYQWDDPTYGGFFMTASQQDPAEWVQELYHGTAGERVFAFMNLYQGMWYLMALLYFVWLFWKHPEPVWYLGGLILIGEFFFSAMWESKSRYVYPYVVITMPCVAFSIATWYQAAIDKITKIRADKRQAAEQ